MRSITATVLGIAVVLALAGPISAQQTGVVNVDVSNVKTEIAKNIQVDVSQIPVTVQAPIDVAAAVCGVQVGVLSAQGSAAQCKATSTNTALNQIVQQKAKKG